MEIEKLNRNRIIQELKEAGYVGKAITYEELKGLCAQYGRGLREVDFAQEILGISYGNYMNCKSKGTRVRILKGEKKEITEEERKEIIEELKEAGYERKAVTYEELKGLCAQYGRGLREVDFAQEILGITYANYMTCKNKGQRVRILKGEKKEITEEERKEIIEELKEEGYEGKLVTYEELKELCNQYGRGLREVDFAQEILGITYGNYMICKNKGQRVRILKGEKKEITEEERKEIIEGLKEEGYEGKSVTYEELKGLCAQYGRGLREVDFAQEILGIGYSNYRNCKNEEKRVRILKEEKKEITEEERKEIIEELKEEGYEGKSVTYEELKGLCAQYGRGLREVDFAQEILDISYGNYINCKSKGTRVRILKRVITEEERREIVRYLKEAGYEGKSVIYEELKELCNQYGRGLEEKDFAQKILGVSYGNYRSCRNKETRVIIKDGIILNKAKEIQALFIKESQYYSKEYIEKICNEYEITIDDFLTYIVLGNFYDNQPFKNALEDNNGLWIGKVRMSIEFVQENIKRIEQIATDIAKSLCGKYRIKQKKEDYKQDLIIYIIENMGDLEKNLGNTEELFNIVRRKAKRYCEGKIIDNVKINNKFEGFYKKARTGKSDNIFEVQYADEEIDIESEVENKIEKEEPNENEMDQCINLLKKCIENGMNRSEAIAETARIMNTTAETMLEYMKRYLLEKGKVKEVKGRIMLGEAK